MICTDFESILVPEDNGKQNLEEFYTNKNHKHIICSHIFFFFFQILQLIWNII